MQKKINIFFRYASYILNLALLIFSTLGVQHSRASAATASVIPSIQSLEKPSLLIGDAPKIGMSPVNSLSPSGEYLETTPVFQWPTTGTIGFAIYVPGEGKHHGVDIIAPSTSSLGDEITVYPVYPGVIKDIWTDKPRVQNGVTVPGIKSAIVIYHEDLNLYSLYMHMGNNSTNSSYIDSNLKIGDPVTVSTRLGKMGNRVYDPDGTLETSGAVFHLHFAIMPCSDTGGCGIDPTPYYPGYHLLADNDRTIKGTAVSPSTPIPPPPTDPVGVTIYENVNFGGRSLTLTDSVDNLCDRILSGQPAGLTNPCQPGGVLTWNDTISSIKLSPGYSAVLLLHSRQTDIDKYGQQQARYSCNQNISDLSQMNFDGTTIALNDNISGILIQRCSDTRSVSSLPLSLLDSITNPCIIPPVSLTDQASYIADLNLSDGTLVSPAQSLIKTWRLKNTGSTTWDLGYKLVFASGEQMGAPGETDVPTTGPNQTVDLSVPITAPTASGEHTGYFQLRNPQGTYFGPKIWVKIVVKSSSAPGGNIVVFDLSPASPSAATQVHLLGRAKMFPEFRSVRFVIGNQAFEQPNIRTIGDQIEISMDWNTASLPRGDYNIALEVAKNGDNSWSNPERQIKRYTLNGSPAVTNRPPDRPILLSPYNWFLKDAGGGAASVDLCVRQATDPDGNLVSYFFEVNNGAITSGLVGTCWTRTFDPGTYSWRVKSSDGSLYSDWSVETWNFTVAKGGVYIGDMSSPFAPNSSETHVCVPITYDGIIAPDVYAWINLAADGSQNGEWKMLDHYGPNAAPDCTTANVHGWWIRAQDYDTGNHVIKINAIKRDSGANQTRTFSINIAYMRPPAPQLISPSSLSNNGTWWNTTAITFQWSAVARVTTYTLRVSTLPDPWSDPAPILNVNLGPETNSYSFTFSQDYKALYWIVRASNSAGSADSGGGIWFGIDRVKPTCQVQGLQSSFPDNFQVNWSGNDPSAGIRSFDIQVSDTNREDFRDWLVAQPNGRTYELFNGQPGHTYFFRCRATDNAGNTGNFPATADSFTKIDPAARPPEPWWNTAYAFKRNLTIQNNMPALALPALYPVRVQFTASTNPTAAELYAASLAPNKCDDLRIVYNNTTEVNRVIRSCSATNIDIYFRTQTSILAGTPDYSSHQIYYGNPSPTAPLTNPNQVWYPYAEADTTNMYFFQEGSGSTTVDSSGNNRTCTLGPAVQWTNGKFGSAIRVNQQSSSGIRSLLCGTAPTLTSFTVEFWINTSAANDGRLIGALGGGGNGGAGNNWQIEYRNRIRLEVWPCPGCGSHGIESNFDLTNSQYQGKWNHVAVVFNGGNQVTFWINGNYDSTKTIPDQMGINNYSLPLEIGATESSGQINAILSGVKISNTAKSSFPYGYLSQITSEPTFQASSPIAPPAVGAPDLAVISLNAYPNLTGGVLVEAVVQNQGTLSTINGFFTDLYVNHLPTGSGDYEGSLQFWVNDPIPAGGTATLTAQIEDPISIGLQSEIPGEERNWTLYAQTDSTGAISEPDKTNNITATGTDICVAAGDAYEVGDNGPSGAIILSGSQVHNFDRPGDEDWVKIVAKQGQTYRITTSNLGANADTYIYLYDQDGTTLLASNDDYGDSLASQIEWIASTDGTYYIQAKQWNPSSGGCGTSYSIGIGGGGFEIFLPLVKR